MTEKFWNIYLSGEIHSDWRKDLMKACHSLNLPVNFYGPEMDHDTSDQCGNLLGEESNSFWHDHRSAKINSIKTRTLLNQSDVVVVYFGEKFRQWNAAFEAGLAHAKGLSVITIHDSSLDHALKEVDAAALATCRSIDQLAKILSYVTKKDN